MRFTFAVLGALLLALSPGFAADDTTVQIGGLYGTLRPFLVDLLGVLVAAALGYVTMTIKSRFGIEIEAKHREALHSAAVTGINMALGQLGGRVDNLSIDVKNKLLADALNYVVKGAPQAVEYFGLNEKSGQLMDILKSKLTVALPGPSA